MTASRISGYGDVDVDRVVRPDPRTGHKVARCWPGAGKHGRMDGTDERKCHAMGLRKKKSLIDQANDYVETRRSRSSSRRWLRRRTRDATALRGPRQGGAVIADARGKAAPADRRCPQKAGPASPTPAKAAPVIAEGAAMAADKAATAPPSPPRRPPRDATWPRRGRRARRSEEGRQAARSCCSSPVSPAAAAFVAKKLRGGSTSHNWQSSYTPTPAPPPTPRAPVATSRPTSGGASPDEALADRPSEPHPVTTPDDPAEVVAVEDEPKRSQPQKADRPDRPARRTSPSGTAQTVLRPVLGDPGVDPLPPGEQPVDPLLPVRSGSPRAAPATSA